MTDTSTPGGHDARPLDPAGGTASNLPERELIEALTRWLPTQRWFAAKGQSYQVERVQQVATLTTEATSVLSLVTVRHDDGADVYTVPLLHLSEPVDHLSHALVGVLGADGGAALHVYDALHVKEVSGAWTRGVLERATVDAVVFHGTAAAAELDLRQPSLVSSAEQSNTSLVFGDTAILKVFRRVEHGRNPDIEVHEALAQLGSRHVARLLGWVSATWVAPDGSTGTGDVAMLQEFLRSASDGWQLAQISLRDLFAEADLHAEEVGGDFAGEAYRLGAATAETHEDLASVLPTGSYGPDELRTLADAMRSRLDHAAAAVPAVAAYVEPIGALYDRLAATDHAVPTQRVHGDLHLGQVLRTSHRWVMLDFEGEPAKPVAERDLLDSPLRDIAGMLRSFDYAARYQLVDHPGAAQIAYRAEEWALRNRGAFCDGYAHASGVDPRETDGLLVAYEADKAVYEIMYEARQRPAWLPVPLGGLARLAEAATT